MPKEQRKRGRRAERKRKIEAGDAVTTAKLEASDSGVAIGDGFVEDYNGGGFLGGVHSHPRSPSYCLLTRGKYR
jgi:hypothetical protein